MRHGRVDRFEHQGWIADRGPSAAAFLARHAAVDDDEAGELVRKMGGEGNGQPARSRVPHHDRPLPFQLADDREGIAHIGIDRVVLARAPAGFAEAAFVVARDFAVGGERLGDADPIVGVEVVGAMHEQNGRLAARAEGAVENRYVAGIHPSVALHESRLPARSFLEAWRATIHQLPLQSVTLRVTSAVPRTPAAAARSGHRAPIRPAAGRRTD
jgi:hypothetical protein